ncbi:MAG: HIT family protein [Anaerolinea sp. 4484_236]|nr:MAG: HIT family protein [Anaerolinea sp. 4484_236]RLD04183.1 MAG: HIT family protein [Chloroflexota bacterium]
MSDCVFCRILAGELPSSTIYKDEVCTAILDIQPINDGHVLVIPNEHYPRLADLPPEVGGHLFEVGQRIAAAIPKSGVKCEGVNFFLADGKAAMQDVFHVHLHVIPRYEGDGFGFQFPVTYFELPTRDKLNKIEGYIKDALG